MSAVPSYIGLMKAQARPKARPAFAADTKPSTSVFEVMDRRARLGLAASRLTRGSKVPGVSYVYRGKHNQPKHEFLLIEQRDVAPTLVFDKDTVFLPAWKIILAEVAKKHGMQPRQIRSASRERKIVAARQEACYRMQQETPLSLAQIASKVGYTDHSTVHHSITRHLEREASGR